MKFVSWNVNGLRAAMTKGFKEFFTEVDADIFAIQETKMQQEQMMEHFNGYYEYWSCAIKKGYSGTLVYTKHKPLNVTYGIDGKYSDEGRIITLEYDNFYFVNVYVPNSKSELERLGYRVNFEGEFRAYLKSLDDIKPVILCGDLNVAHKEIDLKYPKANERSAGYTIEERTEFSKLLEAGFTDSFRYLYPNTIKYTWWSYMFNARANNSGWRIDYFIISNRLRKDLHDCVIYDHIYGSDHCPVGITIF